MIGAHKSKILITKMYRNVARQLRKLCR